MRQLFGVYLIVGAITGPVRGEGPVDNFRAIEAGAITLDVRIASTANLFHVVDQLSGWSPFCHAQYRRRFAEPAQPGDQALLEKHALIRRKKGWGNGLEQTFYTGDDLETALARGVERGDLTAAQADVEREVLTHFRGRVEALMEDQARTLAAFVDRLEADRKTLAAFSRKTSRFFGVAQLRVPVYLIANPAERDHGGGFNGGRLTLEIPSGEDILPAFFHELIHAYIEDRRADLEAIVDRTVGLDYQTLNEGIAHALSPGLFSSGAGPRDPLLETVRADLRAKRPFAESYTRANRFALGLRPVLSEAMDDEAQTLTTFLPRAVDAWKCLAELSEALADAPRGRKVFSFGPGWRTLEDRAKAGRNGLSSFNHHINFYRKGLGQARRGDSVVLLFALDNVDRSVPPAYADLLPRPWPEIEAELRAGRTFEAEGVARGLRTIVLAAPTAERLEAMIRESTLLE